VRNIEIASVLILLLVALTVLLIQIVPGQARRRTRAVIGLVPGMVGALVVAALVTDLVPDTFERVAAPWVILAVTAGVVVLAVTNLIRQ
jgi:uncharacterized membrane protein YeaQ/YmgE (transglycosylase-associated protein family)